MSRSRLRNEPRASFEFEVTEDKIVQIIDQDRGRSVTNDIENVLADVAEAEGVATLAGYQVIYRDTEKDWCRVQLDAAGRFQGYAYFGTDQAAAVARLRAQTSAGNSQDEPQDERQDYQDEREGYEYKGPYWPTHDQQPGRQH